MTTPTPLHKMPLAQACKEAKGSIEFHSAVVHTAKEINELATLLEGDPNTRTIAAATYLGLSQLSAAVITSGKATTTPIKTIPHTVGGGIMTTTNEAPYGRMAWGINSSNPDANEAWRKRMEHAATVMNRASDVFYAEAGHDLDRPYQWHPTHVQLAAAAVADQMAGQGLHPVHDSFAWSVYGSSHLEMGELQNTLTAEECQEVDDLARETLAQRMVAVLLHKALNDNSDVPLADFIVESLEHTTSSELQELVKLATRTQRDQGVQS